MSFLNKGRLGLQQKNRPFDLTSILLAILAIANLLTIYNVRLFGIVEVLWLLILVPITGSIIINIFLDLKKFNFGEWLIYSVGLGLASDMALGLIINTAGLLLHQKTLVPQVIIPTFDVIFVALLIARHLYAKSSHLLPSFFPDVSNHIKVRILLPLIFPFISVLGAIRLNNGGTNNIALSLIFLVCAYLIWLMIFVKQHYEAEYLSSLFGIGIALGLSYAMRSNHIIGSDINGEFQVFSTTVKNGIWLPHLFPGSSYNACLSITVLPAFLHAFMRISTEYFFKIIMQVLLGIIPLVVYVIALNRFGTRKYLAYISTLFFMVQVQFILEFPALIRQQVATLFFGLIFAVATSKHASLLTKKILILLFGLAMIPSHYSTAYVCIGLLLLVSLLRYPLNKIKNIKHKEIVQKDTMWLISLPVIIMLTLTTFLWYGETLQASGGLLQKISKSVTSFSSIFNADSHSQFVVNAFGVGGTTYNSQTLARMSAKNSVQGGYNPSPTEYQPVPYSIDTASPHNTSEQLIYSGEHKFLPLAVNVLLIIGLAYMVFRSLFKSDEIHDAALAFASGLLFILLAVLPSISEDYNLERLYQQLLVLIAPAFVYGMIVLLRFKFAYVRLLGILILVVYLLYSTGLIDQAVFGVSNVNLTNGGTNYVHFYTTDGATDSLSWLQSTYNHNPAPVNVDYYSFFAVESHTSLQNNALVKSLFPSEITPNSYVYSSETNVHGGFAFDYYENQVVTYNFPQSFLDKQKNLVFNDQDNVIYK